jgi:hypothetical protein
MSNDDLEMGMWDREYPSEQEIIDQQEAIEHGALEGYDDEYEEDYDDEFYEDFIEEYDEEEEVNTVNEAHVRLEQGRLYNMLINHNLFEGVDADPTAIANVQRQLKDFILEKLEEMLGMRAKKEKAETQQVVVQSDFNELEIQVLKRVASKMSKGMTENAPDPKPVQSELNTVKKEKPSKGLNSLGGQKKQQPKQQPKQKAKPPVAKKKRKPKPQRKQRQAQSQDNLAQKSDNEEIGFMERFKGKSLEEANEIVAQRHKRPIPKVTINQDAVNSYYTQKVAMADTKMSDYGKLMKMAALSKAQQKG